MADKESLRRQIELLQGLISKHKNVHGNAPAHAASATRIWKNPAQPTHSTRGTPHAGPSQGDYQQQQYHHQQLQHQQQKTQQQYPGNTWKKKYSLVNKPQGPSHPSRINSVPTATAKALISQDLGQKSSVKMTTPKGPGTLTSTRATVPAMKPPVGTGSSSGYSPAARMVVSAGNPRVATSRTSVGRSQSTGREEQAKSAPTSMLLSQRQSPTEGRDGRKRAHLKQAEATDPSTSAVKVARPGNSATKRTSELCKMRIDSALALSMKTLNSPTLPTREPHWTPPLKKSEAPFAAPSDSDTGGRLGGNVLKEGNPANTVAPTSTSQATPSGACANSLKRRLATPTPPGKVSKCKKTKYTWVANPTRVSRTASATPTPPGKVSKCKKTEYTWVANPTRGSQTVSATPSPPEKVSKCKKTKYTWMANPARGSRQASATPTPPGKVSKCRKTKYTWVANPVKGGRTLRKSVSPKAPESAKKTPIVTEKTLPSKVSPKGDAPARSKKTGIHSKSGTSSSKYKWNATNPVLSISPSKSAFKWQAETQKERGGSQLSGTRACLPQASGMSKSPLGDSAHPGYKLKSRTKLIRRKSFTGSPTDKKSSPLPPDTIKSHYFLRRRTPPKAQAVKKISPRGLVQISKHRLRRLPPTKPQAPLREASSPHAFRSPSSTKVITTRYKIVKRSVAAPPYASISPTLLWKARKLSAARWLLLNRMRQISPTGRSNPLQQQRWKSRGLRCIGGVMYKVSANKLSKHTSPPIKANDRSSKYFTRSGSSPSSPSYVSPTSTSRSGTPSRYIASRAVQRSLAIIRLAKQKKEKKKEYCMYYNRFGKCNRGESCPYIHDSEKVAVCTRFLRGTCKKTDGTCSFSHKVAKEKMPVCSFFLRGICNNNSCPYSHVYVSRKAEVCQDFLKGYCPLGEKCKKKHTLLCPDFSKTGSCPKGAKCKLQHRQRKHPRRHSVCSEHSDQDKMMPRQGRHGEGSSRFHEEKTPRSASEQAATSPTDLELPGPRGLRRLPSFISLKSSPTSPIDERPPLEREKPSEDTGKKIQIKPRL